MAVDMFFDNDYFFAAAPLPDYSAFQVCPVGLTPRWLALAYIYVLHRDKVRAEEGFRSGTEGVRHVLRDEGTE